MNNGKIPTIRGCPRPGRLSSPLNSEGGDVNVKKTISDNTNFYRWCVVSGMVLSDLFENPNEMAQARKEFFGSDALQKDAVSFIAGGCDVEASKDQNLFVSAECGDECDEGTEELLGNF